MRNVLRVLSVGLLLGMPAVAVAGPSATGYGATQAAGHEATWWWPSKPARPVPELSVGGAGAAVAVLVGGVLMMAERRRRESSK